MLRLGAERDEVRVVDDQRGSPTYVGHLAAATRELLELPRGIWHVAADGECTLGRVRARRSSRRPASSAACVGSRPRSSARRRRGRRTRCCAASAPRRRACRTGVRACASASAASTALASAPCGPRHRRRGFIGSHFVRRSRGGRRGRRPRQAHLLGQPANLEGVDARVRRSGDIADSRGGRARRRRAATRSSTSPPRRTSTARSSRPATSSRPTSSARTCCSSTSRGAAVPVRPGLDRRGLRRRRAGERARARTTRCGRRARTRRRRPAATCRCSRTSRTYGVDASITRGANTYGPNQYPEKLIPLFVTNALDGEPLPVYGDGRQARDWLHVEDHCAAIELVLREGAPGEVYNVGRRGAREPGR